MPIISLLELKRKPVPVSYGEVYSYTYFFENKLITIEVVNEHEFIVNFIFEDSKGKRKYSYLDQTFKSSPFFQYFKAGNFAKERFGSEYGNILYRCLFSYLDEPSLIKVLNDFGYYSEVPCTSEYQKAFFVENISFYCDNAHREAKERVFTICTKIYNKSTNYDNQLRIEYVVQDEAVCKTIKNTEQTLFPSIFNLLHYSKQLLFKAYVNIFNDSFTCYLSTKNDFVRITYLSGELQLNCSRTKFCEGNRTRDPEEIQRVLLLVVLGVIQHEPTEQFIDVFKDIYGDKTIDEMTVDELKCLDMYQI